MKPMTSRTRWQAALKGEPVDRIPFWPKIFGSYLPSRQEPFRSMSIRQLHAWIGSDEHVPFAPLPLKETRHRTSEHVEQRGHERLTTIETPAGTLTQLDGFDEPSLSWHPIEFPVKTAADLPAMGWYYADPVYDYDPEAYERGRAVIADYGEEAYVASAVGRSPLMDWLEFVAGVEGGLLLLADHRAEVEGLFDQMHTAILQRTEIVVDKGPYDLLYSVEDTSTTLISPKLFQSYCMPHLGAYGEMITAGGKMHMLHMCGQIKKLLPDIATLPAQGIEAYTSAPIGDTSFGDGRAASPRLCFVGGTNASLWLESPEVIIATIAADLDALPHHRGIVVSSAGVQPPGTSPETLRAVADWLKQYPVRC